MVLQYECKLSLIDYEFFQTKDTDNKIVGLRMILSVFKEQEEGVVSPERDPTGPTNPNPHTKPTTTERKGLSVESGKAIIVVSSAEICWQMRGNGASSEELLIASHIFHGETQMTRTPGRE